MSYGGPDEAERLHRIGYPERQQLEREPIRRFSYYLPVNQEEWEENQRLARWAEGEMGRLVDQGSE